jgi:hypothetical protein
VGEPAATPVDPARGFQRTTPVNGRGTLERTRDGELSWLRHQASVLERDPPSSSMLDFTLSAAMLRAAIARVDSGFLGFVRGSLKLRKSHRSLLASAAMACLTSCGSNVSHPMSPAPTASAISVSPKGPAIAVGDTLQLSSAVRSTAGALIDPQPSTDWVSRSPSVVGIDSVGRTRGVSGGSAWVVAKVRSVPTVADSTHFTVVELVSPPPLSSSGAPSKLSYVSGHDHRR